MDKVENAIIYATEKLSGLTKETTGCPYIVHSLEVMQILATLTQDTELLTAGVLQNTVNVAGVSSAEISGKFGRRVAELVSLETYIWQVSKGSISAWIPGRDKSISELKNTTDDGVRMFWLACNLANIHAMAASYSVKGEEMWGKFAQADREICRQYYVSIYEILEIYYNRTSAFKEFAKHINYIWPGNIESKKERYTKYRAVSVDGCKIIGRGAKSVVYRYDDELIVKVYNERNMYKDIERENRLAKKTFFANIPTAISFGIVTVGDRYGSMFELIDSSSVAEYTAKNLTNIEYYAGVMADLALQIHSTDAESLKLDDYMPEVFKWNDGLKKCAPELAGKIDLMLKNLPKARTAIHGDFHPGNVMMQRGEPLLIDMDRFSRCHPIVDLCGMYMALVGFGEFDPTMPENFMGLSVKDTGRFYDAFIHRYFKGKSESFMAEANDKIALICYVRLVRKVYKKGDRLTDQQIAERAFYLEKIKALVDKVDSFEI